MEGHFVRGTLDRRARLRVQGVPLQSGDVDALCGDDPGRLIQFDALPLKLCQTDMGDLFMIIVLRHQLTGRLRSLRSLRFAEEVPACVCIPSDVLTRIRATAKRACPVLLRPLPSGAPMSMERRWGCRSRR